MKNTVQSLRNWSQIFQLKFRKYGFKILLSKKLKLKI